MFACRIHPRLGLLERLAQREHSFRVGTMRP